MTPMLCRPTLPTLRDTHAGLTLQLCIAQRQWMSNSWIVPREATRDRTFACGIRYLQLAAGRSVNASNFGVRPTSITQPSAESAVNSGVRDHFVPSRTMSWRTIAPSIAVHRDLPGSTQTNGILPGST